MVASRVLATALVREGKCAIAIPKFGAERRGAPVVAFTSFDDKPIRQKTQLYHPNCLIVIDPLLTRSVNVFEGLQINGILIVDTAKPVIESLHKNLKTIGSIDATRIGLEEIGRPITNSAMLGAFARTTGWGIAEDKGLDAAKLAVETNYFPLWEAEHGNVRITHDVTKPKPIHEYTKLMGRYSHLTDQDLDQLQKFADNRYNMIRLLASSDEVCKI